ncbi:hypothetical protein BC332_24602 [Capsicum chinense]|nr:hypothetical protein BC332_24602 [Capsicum chinense]
MSSPRRARSVEIPHQWVKGYLVSLYGLEQSSPHELAFEVELGPRSITLSWYQSQAHPVHYLKCWAPHLILSTLQMSSPERAGEGDIEVPHRWVKGSLVSLYGIEQSSPHELTFQLQVIIAKANVDTKDMTRASVASLMRTIESLLTSNSPIQSLTCDHREEFSALHGKISSLEVVAKNFEKNILSGEMTDLEVEIIEVANIVEQTIQLRITEVVLENDENKHERLSDTLQLVAEDIDCIRKESTKIQDKGKQVSEGSLVHDFSSSTNNILNVNNNMVGRDDQKERLIEDLTTSYPGEPKVIPIVVMGGIGKTTLAKEVYNHESILRRFDARSWATVSQRHNIKEILLSLLQSTIKMDDTDKTKGEAELADMLQKSLKRKRYLIVLDDI